MITHGPLAGRFGRRWAAAAAVAHLTVGADARAQPPGTGTARSSTADSALHAMRMRGAMAMGVDQSTSLHHFTPLSDGGWIRLERVTPDSAGAAQIRRHLHAIARAFSTGDFSVPMFVHMRSVPGTRVMADKRAVISYVVTDLPRGAAIRITTHDPEAVRAVHEFLAFQRSDHRAPE
jgi:hypothetical protein